MSCRSIWIGTYPDRIRVLSDKNDHARQSIFVNRKAQMCRNAILKCNDNASARLDCAPSNQIVGAASIRLRCRCDSLVLLGDFGRLQYLFWKESVPATSIYVFDVVQIEKVELGLAMNEFVSYNQKIACALDLTPDCCARLINEAWPDPATRPSWSNDMLPAAIRIPAIFATMLLGGKGQELLLPDHGEEGTTRSMF